MTGGYHIINATGTVIKTTTGYSDHVFFDGTIKDIIDAIKNNKLIVIEGQKTKRGDNTPEVNTGAWVLNFVHDFMESDETTVDNYEAVVFTGGVKILFEINWEENDFGYSVSAL